MPALNTAAMPSMRWAKMAVNTVPAWKAVKVRVLPAIIIPLDLSSFPNDTTATMSLHGSIIPMARHPDDTMARTVSVVKANMAVVVPRTALKAAEAPKVAVVPVMVRNTVMGADTAHTPNSVCSIAFKKRLRG